MALPSYFWDGVVETCRAPFRGGRCGQPAEQLHHVVYAQHVRRHGGDLNDGRNLLPLCYDCHRRHHNRIAVIPVTSLPDVAVEFAHELLGEAAPDYLGRYYA